MKPLVVLLVVFVLAVVAVQLITQQFDLSLAARIAMCAMLFFTAVGHFAFTKGMILMMPSVIPFKKELVYLTAVLEILLGIGLLIPDFTVYAAWALIAFFVLLLPANINAAIKHVDHEKGTYAGKGVSYLWFRVPLQLLFIGWTYFSSIKIWE
ncbi:DoxX family protein [Salmonirosea aquatica]|uniref:DoxX family membrane protein n=1 Tax=Salmonirosea aquatica TaxID=2654236 RepID=A0A7C9BHF2_9BACT|nr:hypothetical protein [Cytophagaceae bacterium SJW1-29]